MFINLKIDASIYIKDFSNYNNYKRLLHFLYFILINFANLLFFVNLTLLVNCY